MKASFKLHHYTSVFILFLFLFILWQIIGNLNTNFSLDYLFSSSFFMIFFGLSFLELFFQFYFARMAKSSPNLIPIMATLPTMHLIFGFVVAFINLDVTFYYMFIPFWFMGFLYNQFTFFSR